MATSAHALDADVTAPAAVVTPALELDFPQPAANTAPLQFELFTETGAYPSGNNIVVQLTLPSGTSFSSAATGANVTGNCDTTRTGSGAACGGVAVVGAAGVSATLQNGGGVGATTAEYLVSVNSGVNINELAFDFDIRLDACVTTPTALTITAEIDGSGTNIEDGIAVGDDAVAACASALNGVVFDDEPTDDDNFIELPDFVDLDDSQIGYINYSFSGAARSIDGTAVDATDVTSVTFDVVFPDADSDEYIDDVYIDFDSNTCAAQDLVATDNGDGTYTFAITAGNIALFTNGGNTAATINVNQDALCADVLAGNTDPIPTQQLSVDDATVVFNDTNANFVATEAGAEGNIDLLNREGQAFGFFDWNGSAGTNSVYRVTGLPVGEAIDYTVTFERSNPATADGTYTGTVTSTTGEAVLTSFDNFGLTAGPDFTRADVLMNFEVATVANGGTADLDVDRLMARNGVVSAFNDGANFDDFGNDGPNNDADENNDNE
ncbi:MAG: hypothetical protein WBG08_11030 [Litorimonas sp.]